MISSYEKFPELRRARPSLGTLVEITVPDHASAALQHAFEAVAQVHALMSAHDPASDLGRLARLRPGQFLTVHPWTWRVLVAAKRFHRLTRGAFDPVIAATLAIRRGDLAAPRPPPRAAAFSDVLLGVRCRVSVRRALSIDLGGIAKGFAVDEAVRVLRRAGVAWGLVNAGGDLRAFGPRSWPIHVRHPAAPGALLLVGELRAGAVATSAPYFSERAGEHGRISALVDPRTGRHITGVTSVTVLASTCLAADALAKAALLNCPASVFRRCRARVLRLDANTPLRHAA